PAWTWPEDLARAWWRWACACEKHEVRRFVGTTTRMSALVQPKGTGYALRDDQAARRVWKDYTKEHLTPALVVLGLESLVEDRQIERGKASGLEERLLAQVD